MKNIIKVICLLIISSNTYSINVDTPIGDIDFNGHITLFGYQTSKNSFNEHNTQTGTWRKSKAGLLTSYEATDNLSFKLYTTTDYLVDYGFADINLPTSNRVNTGLRIGRVNRLSGLFSGMGPHVDRMNFLPQGTNADRIGRVFYRFDGVQLYATTVFATHHIVSIEFTYGNPQIPDDGGVFDPSFFAMFDPHTTNIDTNSPSPVLNLNYTYKDWEIFADYYEMDIKFSGDYVSTWDADITSRMLGIPRDTIPDDFILEVRESVSVEDYPAYGMSFGISKAFGDTEVMYMYSRQVGSLNDPDLKIGNATIGGRLVPEQHAITIRHHIKYDMIYGGASYFKSFYDQDDLYEAGVIAPKYITYGKGIFIGGSKQLTPNMDVILEYRHNRGSSFLSSTYQAPLESEKIWNVVSVSLNVVF